MSARKTLQALTERQKELVSAHLHLVGIVARCMERACNFPASVQHSELEAAGNYGLVDAATKFDESRTVQFAAYAKWRIRGAIVDYLRQQDWLSRVGRHGKKVVDRAFEELRQQLQRDPDDGELADKLGMTVERCRFVRLTFEYAGPVSASEVVLRDKHGEHSVTPDLRTAGEYLGNPSMSMGAESRLSTHHMFRDRELIEIVAAAVRTLPERYQEMIRLYYAEELSMKEVGERLEVGESRISQMHRAALERLHLHLRKHGIPSLQAFDLAA